MGIYNEDDLCRELWNLAIIIIHANARAGLNSIMRVVMIVMNR
jgi:hypothetical protein